MTVIETANGKTRNTRNKWNMRIDLFPRVPFIPRVPRVRPSWIARRL